MIVNEDKKGKMKVLFPDDIETITISKNDYDRLYGELTYQNIELQQENARLKDKNKKVLELLQILHYNFPDYDDMHKKIEDIEEILKEN